MTTPQATLMRVQAVVEFVWDARVAGVRSAPTGVTLTGESGRTWSATHVIAADGARSAVRRGLGIPREGSHGSGFHVAVDVADIPGGELPLERVFHYEHPRVGGRSVMRVPFTGGFQLDLQCRDDDSEEEYGTQEAVRRRLPAVVGEGYEDRVLRVSTYRFLREVAAGFTDPQYRVLLAGEAAHLFPPFGVRGMNGGIADAGRPPRPSPPGPWRRSRTTPPRGGRRPCSTAPPRAPLWPIRGPAAHRTGRTACRRRPRPCPSVVRCLAGARPVQAPQRLAGERRPQVLREEPP
nr:FAD-dependent monooxygenase [Streptomyces sp. Ru72]